MNSRSLTSNIPLRLDVFVEVWLDKAKPLLDAALDISTSLTDVAKDFLAAQVRYKRHGRMISCFAYAVAISRDQHLLR